MFSLQDSHSTSVLRIMSQEVLSACTLTEQVPESSESGKMSVNSRYLIIIINRETLFWNFQQQWTFLHRCEFTKLRAQESVHNTDGNRVVSTHTHGCKNLHNGTIIFVAIAGSLLVPDPSYKPSGGSRGVSTVSIETPLN